MFIGTRGGVRSSVGDNGVTDDGLFGVPHDLFEYISLGIISFEPLLGVGAIQSSNVFGWSCLAAIRLVFDGGAVSFGGVVVSSVVDAVAIGPVGEVFDVE